LPDLNAACGADLGDALLCESAAPDHGDVFAVRLPSCDQATCVGLAKRQLKPVRITANNVTKGTTM
jgi:hypothetical protein